MGGLPSDGERALDRLPPALYQGPSASEEVKPVVARLVVFGAAVGSLALLAGAVMLVLRLAQPTEVEPGAILLTSEPPGSGVVPVVVTKDTRIMPGTIEGRMNDVRAGGRIKVADDLHEGKKLARAVEGLPKQGARPAAIPPAAAAPVVQPPQPGAPAPGPKAEPPRVAQPKAPTPVPAPPPVVPAPARPTSVAPAPTPPPPAVVTPAPPAPAVPAPVAPASASPRPATPAPTPEPDSTDGSAAVDWFLKGRR